MKKCKDCGAMVSHSARQCPKCGKVLNWVERLIVIAIVTAALAWFFIFWPAMEDARRQFDAVKKAAERR